MSWIRFAPLLALLGFLTLAATLFARVSNVLSDTPRSTRTQHYHREKNGVEGDTTAAVAADEQFSLPHPERPDLRAYLPHWDDWSPSARRDLLARAHEHEGNSSTAAAHYPPWFPALTSWGRDVGSCALVEYLNESEVLFASSASTRKWLRRYSRDPLELMRILTEILFKKYHRRRYLNGLDVGALHKPKPMPRVKFHYLDHRSLKELYDTYPEHLPAVGFVTDPDYVDTIDNLTTIHDNSMDFIILSHMLEHSRQPLRALRNALRVARRDAIVYLEIPNMCISFDKFRLRTRWEHHLEEWFDANNDTEANEGTHHLEAALEIYSQDPSNTLANVTQESLAIRAEYTTRVKFSIHYHTWTSESFLAFLKGARRDLRLPFSIVQCGFVGEVHGLGMYCFLRRL